VCRLNLLGECSTCGSGKSIEGAKKRAAQERLLGSPCPVLACAMDRDIAYCPRDCDEFPCGHFREGPYPFSHAYLNMQERRRQAPPPSLSPLGQQVTVPETYWQDLANSDLTDICKRAQATRHSSGTVILPFFNTSLLIDADKQEGYLELDGQWRLMDHPLSVLMAVVYLLNVCDQCIAGPMVGVQELKCAHFFQGPHKLKTESVLSRYGNDSKGLVLAAERLGGEPLGLADVSYKFQVFPKVPVYYLLWEGNEEFSANLAVLFDRSIESHLAADSIWGIVNLVSDLLVLGQGITPLLARG